MNEQERPYHPAADIFPMMQGDEFEALKADIAAHGLHDPITLDADGAILDGRNRHMACTLTDKPLKFEKWDGEGSAVDFVLSRNLHRRHLNETQRAMVANKISNMSQGERTDLEPSVNLPKVSQSEAAKMLNVSTSMVGKVKAIERDAPELLPEMEAGNMTANKASKEVKKAAREPKPAIVEASKSPRLLVGRAEKLELDNESIDLIITSPPYNLESGQWPMGGNGRVPRTSGIGYDDDIEENDYQAWQINVLIELYRVAKQGASLFYNHKPRNREGALIHPLAWILSADNPWTLRQEIIWDRGSTHNHSPALFWPEDERVYWLTKGKPKLPDRPIGISTVWRFHGPVADTWHPAPFAEELPRRCIDAVGREGITVLDPFAGSCTVARVALTYNYDAVAVDISEEYLLRAAKENGWKYG